MTDTQPTSDTENTTTTQTPARDPSVILPGDLSQKLKSIREQAEMNAEQAAGEMRLSPAIVNALESENFKDLPDPPYVRGYLRSYARLNGSDPQDLIRTYEVLRGGDVDVGKAPKTTIRTATASTTTSGFKDTKGRDNRVRVGSGNGFRLFGLVFVVALLAILSMVPSIAQWAKTTWSSFSEKATLKHPTASMATTTLDTNTSSVADTSSSSTSSTSIASTTATTTPDSSTTTTPTTDATASATPSTTTSTVATTAPATTTSSTTPPTDPAATSATTTTTALTMKDTGKPSVDGGALSTGIKPADTTATPAPEAKPADATTTAAATTTTPSTTPTDAMAANAATPATATTTPAPAATPEKTEATTTAAAEKPAPAPRQQPIDGPVLVRMEFMHDAWLQVRDGRNKIIFEALNTANTWKEFKTGTPLTFKIGNADGVRIYFNGQPYNLAPYTKGSVARFTIN